MTIDNYLRRLFMFDGRTFYIEKVEDHISGANGYIICDGLATHRANISGFSETGFRWFGYLLGVEVQGTISYADIEKNWVIN